MTDDTMLSPMARAMQEQVFAEATHMLQAGEFAMARDRYLTLTDRPELLAPCLHQLGLIAAAQGDVPRAFSLFRQALAVEPGLVMGYRSLAELQERTGAVPAAIGTMLNLGNVLKVRGRNDEAVSVYRHILERDPLSYAAAVNLGTTLAGLHQLEEATRQMLRGLRLYGRQYAGMAGFPDEVLALLPESARVGETPLPDGTPSGPFDMLEGALVTLGKLFKEQGHADAAVACYRRALQEAPGYALAHWNLAIVLLKLEEYREGWQEYEWRWRWPEFPEPHRALPMPVWQDEELTGRRILVWSEQGMGDTIQFLPLVSRLVEQGAEVVLEVPAALVRLFAFNLPDVQVIERSDHPDSVKSELVFDYTVPTMSLPHRLGLSVDELPLAQNYLRPLPEDEEAWGERIPSSPEPRVGLVWAGRPQHANDVFRSLPFEAMRALAETEGVRWYSLQVGPRSEELQRLASGQVIDLAPHLEDLGQTAAALARLDWVVAVDTAVAHLAGAMGVPAWVMLPRYGDWRWGDEGESSAWYPGLRLFRQQQSGEWETVVETVKAGLASPSGSDILADPK